MSGAKMTLFSNSEVPEWLEFNDAVDLGFFAEGQGRSAVIESERKFLANDNFATGSLTSLTKGFAAGTKYVTPDNSGEAMEALGGVNDISTGTGAHSIRVFGLVNWMPVFEDVDLNGATPVPLSNSFNRVFRVVVTKKGSSGFNQADILVRQSGGGNTFGIVGSILDVPYTGANQSQQANYTVKAGYRAVITGINELAATSTTNGIELNVGITDNIGDFAGVQRVLSHSDLVASPNNNVNRIIIDEKTDIDLFGVAKSGSSLSASGNYRVELWKKSSLVFK
jgi:hypothetical protein